MTKTTHTPDNEQGKALFKMVKMFLLPSCVMVDPFSGSIPIYYMYTVYIIHIKFMDYMFIIRYKFRRNEKIAPKNV